MKIEEIRSTNKTLADALQSMQELYSSCDDDLADMLVLNSLDKLRKITAGFKALENSVIKRLVDTDKLMYEWVAFTADYRIFGADDTEAREAINKVIQAAKRGAVYPGYCSHNPDEYVHNFFEMYAADSEDEQIKVQAADKALHRKAEDIYQRVFSIASQANMGA